MWLGCLMVAFIFAFLQFNELGKANAPIWDENYYITSTARYQMGTAQFASHPPLGLMLIAAGDSLSGVNAAINKAPLARDKSIKGEDMPANYNYFGVRCASAAFGVLAAVLFFLLATQILGSNSWGLIFSSLFVFDTALLAQFRAAHLDSFQIAFALAALLVLVRSVQIGRSPSAISAVAFGCAVGLATMVRANGIILLLAGSAIIMHPFLHRALRPAAIRSMLLSSSMVAGFLLVVGLVFTTHTLVTPNPPTHGTTAGDKDGAFLSSPYQIHLDKGEALTPKLLWYVALDYRRFMAADLQGVTKQDANGSSPLQWVVGQKPIVYRWDSNGDLTAYIALVPNQIGWAVSLFGVLASIAYLRFDKSRKPFTQWCRDALLSAILLSTWAALMVSYQYLASQRVMYLYHYFLPLIIGWALAAVVWKNAKTDFDFSRLSGIFAVMFTIACISHFVIMSPLALHKLIEKDGCQLREKILFNNLCNDRSHLKRPHLHTLTEPNLLSGYVRDELPS